MHGMDSKISGDPRTSREAVVPQLFEAVTVVEKRIADLREVLGPISRPSPPHAVKDDGLVRSPGSALPELLQRLRSIDQQLVDLTVVVEV